MSSRLLIVGKSLSVLLQSTAMLYVDCGDVMRRWSDNNACGVVHNGQLYSVLDTVVISGEDV